MCRWFCLLLLLVAIAPARADEPIVIAHPDAFKTLVNPMCSHCRDEAKRRAGELRDDDRVLTWLRGYSDGGAIPIRFFLNPYRVISDTYGVFVYDPDAGFARGFAPSLDFTFHGWRNGVMVMKHKDGTLYSCLSGVAFDGPNKGNRLEPVPTLVSDWGYWLKRYPGAVAYHMFDKYQPFELPNEANAESVKSRPAKGDDRLPGDSVVLGVTRGKHVRAYPVDGLARKGLIHDGVAGEPWVILWHEPTRTAAAYLSIASPPKKDAGAPRPVTLALDRPGTDTPFIDKETGSRWDIAGRAAEGTLKDWTLTWLDGTQVRWRAWAAEYPETALGGKPAKDQPKTVSGSAEFLRSVPKKFATLQKFDAEHHQVELLLEGDKAPSVWKLTPDAEIKIAGWWGRLDQLTIGDRVWLWFRTNRKKEPVAVCMLADELSEQDMHGPGVTIESASTAKLALKPVKGAPREIAGSDAEVYRGETKAGPSDLRAGDKVYVQSAGGKARLILDLPAFAARRAAQQAALRKHWVEDGLPGTVTFQHIFNGELEVMLDHEAMRWARSLKLGDAVTLNVAPPIKAVVKQVTPWGERTRLRLVVNGTDQADLTLGQRLALRMTAPPRELEDAALPPDIDRPRTKEERIEWFLASIYCTCKVGGDGCTGHFYTLACCNPNTCGMPNRMRKTLAERIEQGMTDRQIFEQLLKEQGPTLIRPHLLP
jgi:hypothetical protein